MLTSSIHDSHKKINHSNNFVILNEFHTYAWTLRHKSHLHKAVYCTRNSTWHVHGQYVSIFNTENFILQQVYIVY